MIHNTAIVSEKATLGANVSIGAFTTIHDGVIVGDGSVIDSNCEIGYPSILANCQELVFGESTKIRSHSIFYAGSVFGDGLTTGHRVTVRENTNAGKNLQIGTLCDFQGDCDIGDYVRTHSNVHIGKKSRVGNYVWIFPYVVLTNDPHPPSDTLQGVTIDDYAVIATMSVVLPDVHIGEHALIAAHSMVKNDVEPGKVVGGSPAKVLCDASDIKLTGTDENAYPWPRHFDRGFPDEVVAAWKKRFS